MLIYNATQKKGAWKFDLALSNAEVDYLVNNAMAELLTKGLITLVEQLEEQEVSLPTVDPTIQ